MGASVRDTSKMCDPEIPVEFDEWVQPDRSAMISVWKCNGATNAEIAEKIGITRKTLYEWRKRPIVNRLGEQIRDKKGNPVKNPIDEALRKGTLAIIGLARQTLFRRGIIDGDVAALKLILLNLDRDTFKASQDININSSDVAKDLATIIGSLPQ